MHFPRRTMLSRFDYRFFGFFDGFLQRKQALEQRSRRMAIALTRVTIKSTHPQTHLLEGTLYVQLPTKTVVHARNCEQRLLTVRENTKFLVLPS